MDNQRKELVKSYLANFIGRDFANRTLARKIVTENPGIWEPDEIESVRDIIREQRGARGKARLRYANPDLIRQEQKVSEYMAQYMQKPKPPRERNWYLPKHHKSILILSDIHIPYHDIRAIMTALDYGQEHGIDGIYLNGDIIDFAKISRWGKEPTIQSPQVEIDATIDFLYGLKGLGYPIYYKMGNHEDRWNSYLIRQAPELFDLDAMQFDKLLQLEEMDIPVIDSRQMANFGKLLVIHGHEFGESIFSPVNPARGLFLRAKTSVIAGHNHQTSAHHENDLNNSPTVCASIGCLSDLSPEYRPFAFTKWNHGFAIVDIEENGHFTIHNKRIIEGRVR
jgi:predicted phosphodiesterase